MKISVVIPTYNRKNVVMDSINSVLNQKSDLDYEIIVSDDGSKDNTFELFKKCDKRIHYIFNEKNRGVNVARNIGIKHAKGDFIVFLDSDDMLTPDCFSKISEFYKAGKLSKVNLFGTAEVKTGKKMFTISEERMFTYKEWLEGKNITGEFLSVVDKSVLKEDLFDEERFCFERFFWNRIIKKHGTFASPVVMRLYSFEEENRVSKKLLQPESAAKRYADYKEYLDRFGKDYLDFNLKKQYAYYLFLIGFFAIMSKNTKEGRKWLIKSLKVKFNIKTVSLLFLSLGGYHLLKSVYLIFMKFVKV